MVDEFNEIWADDFGYHIELVGWEDTVSVYGRPQATINRDLARCEYFIGMLWRRWGTPPDNLGQYGSGFEEEFERSIESRRSKGTPEMSLFFKEVDDQQLQDPGQELNRVLAFKERIRSEREIIYEEFSSIDEFRGKIRRCVSRYVQAQRSVESRERQKDGQARSSDDLSKIDDPESGKGDFKNAIIAWSQFRLRLESHNSNDAKFHVWSLSLCCPA